MHPTPPDVVVGPRSVVGETSGPIPEGWHCVKPGRHPALIVGLQWPDFGIPNVDDGFWLNLRDDLLEKSWIQNVQVQCHGGHGRTGVAAAILCGLLFPSKWNSVDEIVKWIRSKYCHEAVENSKQFEYIARITGKEWKKEVTGGKEFDYGFGSWGGWSPPFLEYGSSYYGIYDDHGSQCSIFDEKKDEDVRTPVEIVMDEAFDQGYVLTDKGSYFTLYGKKLDPITEEEEDFEQSFSSLEKVMAFLGMETS